MLFVYYQEHRLINHDLVTRIHNRYLIASKFLCRYSSVSPNCLSLPGKHLNKTNQNERVYNVSIIVSDYCYQGKRSEGGGMQLANEGNKYKYITKDFNKPTTYS